MDHLQFSTVYRAAWRGSGRPLNYQDREAKARRGKALTLHWLWLWLWLGGAGARGHGTGVVGELQALNESTQSPKVHPTALSEV